MSLRLNSYSNCAALLSINGHIVSSGVHDRLFVKSSQSYHRFGFEWRVFRGAPPIPKPMENYEWFTNLLLLTVTSKLFLIFCSFLFAWTIVNFCHVTSLLLISQSRIPIVLLYIRANMIIVWLTFGCRILSVLIIDVIGVYKFFHNV